MYDTYVIETIKETSVVTDRLYVTFLLRFVYFVSFNESRISQNYVVAERTYFEVEA